MGDKQQSRLTGKMLCISQFARYVIFIFNLIVTLCAVVLIVFGIIYLITEINGVNVFQEIYSFGIVSMAIGVIILFVTSLAWFGQLHRDNCLLTLYMGLLVILLLLQVALGTLGILKIEPEDFVAETGTLIRELFDAKDKEPMYTLQAQYGCCGVNGSNDYTLTVDGYPVSCCANGNYPCFHPIEEGCASVFSGVIKQYVEIVSFVAIGVAGVEVISIIFAFLVRRTNTHHTFKMKEPLEDETSI
jgi:CD63 antigen